MPIYHRPYSPGQLQFITTSTNRRAPVFLSQRFCRCFVQRLEEVRQELGFLLIGWVLMPEHFHLLLKPQPAESTPLILKRLKEETRVGHTSRRFVSRCMRPLGSDRRRHAKERHVCATRVSLPVGYRA
ncbi:MAG: transposase [Terriglobia bacterium]